ncbi:MAG: hypothetical protein ACYDBT_04690 [Desulfobulbaceae bacterium]
MIQETRTILRSTAWVPFLLLLSCFLAFAEASREQVHQMAHTVMPFDIAQTVHIFKMTVSGGVQQVLAKDPAAAEQIALIRQHLRHEAENFQRGSYADPAKLHGEDMPGLMELQASASGIKVAYAPLPAGAEITFVTEDLHLLTALHRWFGAQLSEHCADARAE